jgi:hypothetical protein
VIDTSAGAVTSRISTSGIATSGAVTSGAVTAVGAKPRRATGPTAVALPGAVRAALDGPARPCDGALVAEDAAPADPASVDPAASAPPSAAAIAAGPAKNTPTANAAALPRANFVHLAAFFVGMPIPPARLTETSAPSQATHVTSHEHHRPVFESFLISF